MHMILHRFTVWYNKVINIHSCSVASIKMYVNAEQADFVSR